MIYLDCGPQMVLQRSVFVENGLNCGVLVGEGCAAYGAGGCVKKLLNVAVAAGSAEAMEPGVRGYDF